ncbi:uncharacterized protein LOC111196914 [Astyanax mexicanus]|uniref:uncharacterized protein LOC111196914 n=1 Tax=Astyanax mexicanus TaxID=7994 RepID=UPI0020CADDBF|nr:uncharacterized protein LOC111196914 [Astyanax mexicanus]
MLTYFLASTAESTFAQGSIPATRPPHSLTPTATFTQSSIPATRPPQSLKPTATVSQPSTSVGGPEQFISPSTLLTSQWSQQEMAHKTTLLLLDLTRTYHSIYFRNKTAFYQKVQQEFRNKGYTLSADKIRKKLGNLLTTYKRAKDRRRATGEAKVTWEYYTQMDDLFGTSGVGSAPPGTLYSTPLFPENTCQVPLSTEKEQSCISHTKPNSPVSEEQPGPSPSTENTTATRRRSTSQPSFHETYEAHAERRTAVLESLVRPDLEKWRRLKEKRRRAFEKKMLMCLGQINEQLKELSRQQETIIKLFENHAQTK